MHTPTSNIYKIKIYISYTKWQVNTQAQIVRKTKGKRNKKSHNKPKNTSFFLRAFFFKVKELHKGRKENKKELNGSVMSMMR